MRLLIIGGSGLVGSHVLRAALARGHQAVGTFREHLQPGLEQLDCARPDDFAALLDKHQPDAVVHAAGWTWVDGCEDNPARALEENCRQPVRLAEICQRHGVRFACFSTSYIFDGEEGPYDEDAKPNPVNIYARSKWRAEQELSAATDGQVLLPRVICVYGEEALRKNFACQVCDAMRVGNNLRLPADQSGNPTWAGDIAVALVALLEQRASGVWHLGGPNPDCGRAEWARQLVVALEKIGVKPVAGFGITEVSTHELGQKAARPLRAGIISRKLPNPTLPGIVADSVFQKIVG